MFKNKVLEDRKVDIVLALSRSGIFENKDIVEQIQSVELIAIKHIGFYNKSKDYVGPNGVLTKLVPRLWMNLGAYLHDGLYAEIENNPAAQFNKEQADLIFKIINSVYKPKWIRWTSVLGTAYYKSVDMFGSIFLERKR